MIMTFRRPGRILKYIIITEMNTFILYSFLERQEEKKIKNRCLQNTVLLNQ